MFKSLSAESESVVMSWIYIYYIKPVIFYELTVSLHNVNVICMNLSSIGEVVIQ